MTETFTRSKTRMEDPTDRLAEIHAKYGPVEPDTMPVGLFNVPWAYKFSMYFYDRHVERLERRAAKGAPPPQTFDDKLVTFLYERHKRRMERKAAKRASQQQGYEGLGL